MKKSERPKREDVDGVDVISNMTDAILVSILSRLSSTEEAIRSSILSRRWRYLWTAIPSIDINMYSFHNWERNKLKEYVDWLFVNRSVDLDMFCLYGQCGFSMSTIGEWIHAAVTRNVKELRLTLADAIELPHCLAAYSSLQKLWLNLDGGGVLLRNVKQGFTALRVLSLTGVLLYDDDEDVVNDFFQGCPLLEELSLVNCMIRKPSLLCISCPKLKGLTIRNRYDYETKDMMCRGIKISCPDLVFLALIGYHVAYNFFFEYCLYSLKQAEIDPRLIKNTKSVYPAISHVESLSIDLYFFSQYINDVPAPALPILKTLVLTTTITAFTMTEFNRILKYYSKLEFLELIVIEELWQSGREVHEGDARDIFTCDLKRAEFFEFDGEKPKLTIDLNGSEQLQVGFTWGNKAAMYSYFKHYCCVNIW